ncbi:MAG: hypothetical protein VKK32_04860 [Candidatus Melainabacteria bacterium]|nr:hypothetical protein [Candidatus Melainabacteria bacterium]
MQRKITEHDLIRELGKYNLKDALLEIGKVSEYLYANPDASDEITNGFAYNDRKENMLVTQESLAYLIQLLIISGANDTKPSCLSKKGEKLNHFLNVSRYLWYNVVHESPKLRLENGEEIRIRDSDIWNAQFWLHLWERQAKYQIQRKSNRRHLLARQYLIFIKAYKHLTEEDAKKEEFKKRHKKLFGDIATEAKMESINPENKFKEKFSLSMKAFLIFVSLSILHDKELSWQQGKYNFSGCIDYQSIKWEDEDLPKIQARLLEVNESIEKDSIIKALMPFSLSYKEFQEKAKELNPINPLMIYPLIRPDRKYKNRYPLFLSPVYPYLRNIILEDALFNALDDIYREEFKDKGTRAAQPFRSFYGDLFEQFIKDLFINIYGEEKVIDLNLEKAKKKVINKKTFKDEDLVKVSDLKIITDKKIYIIEIKSLKLNYHFALKDIYDEDKIEKNIEKLAEGVIQLYSESLACKQCDTKNIAKGATKTKKEHAVIPILLIQDQAFSLINTSNTEGNSILKEEITRLAIGQALDFNFYILPLGFLERNFNRLKNNEISLEDACYKSHSRTVFFNYDESKDTDSPSLDPDIENSNDYYDEAFEELMKF